MIGALTLFLFVAILIGGVTGFYAEGKKGIVPFSLGVLVVGIIFLGQLVILSRL